MVTLSPKYLYTCFLVYIQLRWSEIGDDMTTNEKYEKLKFYQDKDIAVHISTSSGTFYNGDVLSLDEKSIILQDLKLGEVYISFSEITNIQPYKREEKA